MLTQQDLERLVALEANPVLSVYLNLDPAGQQAGRPGHHLRWKSALKPLQEGLPSEEQKRLAPIAEELGTYLQNHRPQGRAWVLFWGTSGLLAEFHLRVPVVDEAQWGRPSLVQLEWLLAGYPPYGVILVDSQRLRFFYLALSEIRSEGERSLSEEMSQADGQKAPAVIAAANPSRGAAGGGDQKEAFEARLAAQTRNFWRSAAQELRDLQRTQGIKAVVLAGPKEVSERFLEALAPGNSLGTPLEIIGHLPLSSDASPQEILAKSLPLIEAQEEQRQQGLVAELLQRTTQSQSASLGLGPTLKVLQSGRVAQLILTHDLEAPLSECAACQYSFLADSADSCPRCGSSSLQAVSLRVLLPLLARRHGAKLEVLHGQAAERLGAQGGIGALWRY